MAHSKKKDFFFLFFFLYSQFLQFTYSDHNYLTRSFFISFHLKMSLFMCYLQKKKYYSILYSIL